MFLFTFTNTTLSSALGLPGGVPPLTFVDTPTWVNTTNTTIRVTSTQGTGTTTLGGNTSTHINQINGGGEIPPEAKKKGMGTIGKVVCGLFIAAAIRKLFNFIFKTKPKNATGINFNGKTIRPSGTTLTGIVDAVLDPFDVATKIQNLFRTIGNKVDGSGVDEHCNLYLQVSPPVNPANTRDTMTGAVVDDFSTLNPQAFEDWKTTANLDGSLPDFFTKFKAAQQSQGLGQLIVKRTTKQVEALRKKYPKVNAVPLVTVLRFKDQTGNGYVIDPQCLVSVQHLPNDIIEQIVGDEKLFRALLGKTRSKYDQSNCNNDCGQLLIEVCPCYSPDTCIGYVSTEKSYDKESCACTKTQMEITFENPYFAAKNNPANAGKSLKEILQAAGMQKVEDQFSQGKGGKLIERLSDSYFGYKTVITVESSAEDEFNEVYTPAGWGYPEL
tara:strand:+ start:1106 stop:2428 length:1323 start_codon:yes stop_codon:yes gene_type:complete